MDPSQCRRIHQLNPGARPQDRVEHDRDPPLCAQQELPNRLHDGSVASMPTFTPAAGRSVETYSSVAQQPGRIRRPSPPTTPMVDCTVVAVMAEVPEEAVCCKNRQVGGDAGAARRVKSCDRQRYGRRAGISL